MGIKDMGSYQNEFFPGALIKFYLKAQKSLIKSNDKEEIMHGANKLIVKKFGGSNVVSKTCFGAKGNKFEDILITCDTIEGKISKKYKKEGKGFDFDFFIEPNEKNGKTVAELIELNDVTKPRRNIIMNTIAIQMQKESITKTQNFNINGSFENRILKLDSN
jgi:hypothetical protein